MPVVEITSLGQPGVEVYGNLTEKQLRHQYEHGNGIFIVESPKVIIRALDAGYEPLSLLCEERHVEGDAAEIISRCPNILGLRTAAMALTDRSVSIDNAQLMAEPRLAIVMGNEGDGLPQATIDDADYVVRIPMSHGVDSLNVAAAAAVAFWQLRGNK